MRIRKNIIRILGYLFYQFTILFIYLVGKFIYIRLLWFTLIKQTKKQRYVRCFFIYLIDYQNLKANPILAYEPLQ